MKVIEYNNWFLWEADAKHAGYKLRVKGPVVIAVENLTAMERGRFNRERGRGNLAPEYKPNPIIHDYSKDSISSNIKRLMSEGEGQKQAVRIALNAARKSYTLKHPGKVLPAYLKQVPIASRKKPNPTVARKKWDATYKAAMKKHLAVKSVIKKPVDHLIAVAHYPKTNFVVFWDGAGWTTLRSHAARFHDKGHAKKIAESERISDLVPPQYKLMIVTEDVTNAEILKA